MQEPAVNPPHLIAQNKSLSSGMFVVEELDAFPLVALQIPVERRRHSNIRTQDKRFARRHRLVIEEVGFDRWYILVLQAGLV